MIKPICCLFFKVLHDKKVNMSLNKETKSNLIYINIYAYIYIWVKTENKSKIKKCIQMKKQSFQMINLFVEIFAKVLVCRPSSGHVSYWIKWKSIVVWNDSWFKVLYIKLLCFPT